MGDEEDLPSGLKCKAVSKMCCFPIARAQVYLVFASVHRSSEEDISEMCALKTLSLNGLVMRSYSRRSLLCLMLIRIINLEEILALVWGHQQSFPISVSRT